jgi:site-specific DNA-methyltransferase (adenine-specific)
MEKEAASAGLFESGGQKIPKLQILTASDVIAGQRPRMPFGHVESLKKATREREDRQGRLLKGA